MNSKFKAKNIAQQAQFERYSRALKKAGCARPVLIVDKVALDHNIDQVKQALVNGLDLRIVAKSLPSAALLRYVMQRTGTNRLMSFHLPFVLEVASEFPDSDILLGKPMPLAAVEHFYNQIDNASAFKPETQLHWLIDSQLRLIEYETLAKSLGIKILVNLEIDVGLHRGGFYDSADLHQALERIKNSPHLIMSGLMGYEAHICKIPSFLGGPKKALLKAKADYQRFRQQVEMVFDKETVKKMIFNTAGSMTYPLYNNQDPATEISVASALVKPSDFDIHTLNHHIPAAFIAAPVLKEVANIKIPMAPGLSLAMQKFGLLSKQACFIYGGNWLASPFYPPGLKRSQVLGHSSNQEMYELPKGTNLGRDEFMFFRPNQSEAVFLQFGDIAVVDGDQLTNWWPVFNPSHENKNKKCRSKYS